ncbi:Putative Ig domain-containing protein [Desulfonema limicola]|uniref:Ig domain-containing protein n=1 Tax=Desulfonema limicola TaxID=45656 RepID=A0A975GIB2_9BACT|nr:putative Ig domain-containing protein [Desulfonema limicola]QTA81748.1 Putative Ig domain-containing protein [Desulfonema limicola]
MEKVLEKKISGINLKNILVITILIILNLIILNKPALAQNLIIEGSPPPALQNEFYSFTPAVYNAAGKKTFEGINIPDWSQFNIETGEISSKSGMPYPLNDHVGLYEGIAIIVSDEAGGIAMLGPLSIEVKNINDAPVIYDLDKNPIISPLPDAIENAEYSFEFLIFDPDLKLNVNEALTINLLNAPSWLGISQLPPDTETGTIKVSLKGKPGYQHPGSTYSIQISVFDQQNMRAVTDPLNIYVKNVNNNPVISGIPETEVKQGGSYLFTPEFKDLDLNLAEDFGDKISFSIAFGTDGKAAMPDWLIFNPATGQLSSRQGRPVNDDAGLVENIVISISDGIPDNSLDDSLAGFDICVKNVNDRPVMTHNLEIPSDGVVKQVIDKASQGQSFTMNFEAGDIDLSLTQRPCNTINDNINFTGINLPPWLELVADPENPLKAKLVNIENRPNNNETGPWQNIEVAVTDEQGGIDRFIFNINVINQNDQPCLVQVPEENIIVYEDKNIDFTALSAVSNDDLICSMPPFSIVNSTKTNIIKANDIDMKYGDQLYFKLVFPGEHEAKLSKWLGIKTKSSTEAELTGVPKNEDVGTWSGIRLIVSDRLNENDPERKTDEYTFNIEVKNTNDPPVFDKVPPNDTPFEIDAGIEWKDAAAEQYQKVSAYDVDFGDSVTYTLVSSPAPAWLNVHPVTGVLSGKPSNIHAGINTITLIAQDTSGAKATWTFSVKVNYINNVPVITKTSPHSAVEDVFFKHTINVDDIDKYSGDILTYKLENAPSWLKLVKDWAQNAVLYGVPLAADVGSNIGIKLTVTDSYNVSDFFIFNIDVEFVNDKPVISGSLPTAVVGRNYYFKPYSYDEEGDDLLFKIETDMEWLTIDEKTGLLTGLPLKKDLGENLISIYVYECCPEVNKTGLGPIILKVIGLEVIILPGDIDSSGTIDLKDCILGLQIMTGISLPVSISKDSDLNRDRIIGLREVIYILRKTSGIIN